MFENLKWHPDRLLIGDVVLRLEHEKMGEWDGGEHAMFFKVQGLVSQYQHFFEMHPSFHPKQIMELGMWDGGSTIFWNEVLKPRKIVGLDLKNRQDSPYFRNYIEARGLGQNIATYWNTNQGDKQRLREIISSDFGGRVDLVIDDCSHLYAPTKASFEAIFPFVAPGGWYIIEDWAWGHWENYTSSKHPWFAERPLTDFITDVLKVSGSHPGLVSEILVMFGFVAIRRGDHEFHNPENFILNDFIVENYKGKSLQRAFFKMRRFFAKGWGKLRQTFLKA